MLEYWSKNYKLVNQLCEVWDIVNTTDLSNCQTESKVNKISELFQSSKHDNTSNLLIEQ